MAEQRGVHPFDLMLDLSLQDDLRTTFRNLPRATKEELKPHKIEDTMAFMFESRFAMRLTRYAVESSELQHDYFEGWQGLDRHFSAK